MRAALAHAVPGGWPASAVEIASEPGGAPYAVVARDAGAVGRFAPGARLPVAVSISHAEGHALCAALWNGAERRRSVGIDLGLVERRSPELVATFFTMDEQSFVRDGAPSERDLRANLVWCAKEAVLKALGVGLTVDTYGLTCLPDPEGGPGGGPLPVAGGGPWTAFVARCGPTLSDAGETVRGRWRTFPGGFVGALACRDEGACSPVPRHPR